MENQNIQPIQSSPFLGSGNAKAINDAINRINSGNILSTDGNNSNIDITPTPYGTNVEWTPSPSSYDVNIVLVNAGPSGEADYTDGRYWAMTVALGQVENAKPTDTALAYVNPSAYAYWGTVFNVCELTTGTHLLPVYSISAINKSLVGVNIYRASLEDSHKFGNDPANSLYVFRGGNVGTNAGVILNAVITSASAINGLIQYCYGITIGHWTSMSTTSAGTWVSDGQSYNAYNSAEDKNTFTGNGTIGTGNTAASSTGIINAGSCAMLPLPVGAYIQVVYRGIGTDKLPYFTIINAMNSSQ